VENLKIKKPASKSGTTKSASAEAKKPDTAVKKTGAAKKTPSKTSE
jgi:hypothetical protein